MKQLTAIVHVVLFVCPAVLVIIVTEIVESRVRHILPNRGFIRPSYGQQFLWRHIDQPHGLLHLSQKRDNFITHRSRSLPLCPPQAVCAEIYRMKNSENEIIKDMPEFLRENYYVDVICQCPDNLPCPKQPGLHTVAVTKGAWHGLCDPACSYDGCLPRQIAQQLRIGDVAFPVKSYIKLFCRCPSHDTASDSRRETFMVGTSLNEKGALMTFDYQCTEDYLR